MVNRLMCMVLVCGWLCGVVNPQAALAGDDPFADVLVSFQSGDGQEPGYDDPFSTLGSPERVTGEIFRFPAAVTAFNPCWGTDEVYSLGAGGQITLQFNTPVTDDPNNPYGIDLIIFGNTGFSDESWPSAIVDGLLGNEGGLIEVSVDGTNWIVVPSAVADGPMPTLGYFDTTAYDAPPGSQDTDFTRPMDPLLTAASFDGMTHAQVVQRYLVARSGGGVDVDLAWVGLSQITHVRVSNPLNAQENVEVEAMSDVSPRQPGDANLDEVVNIQDLLAVIGAWGTPAPGAPPVDLDLNGVVNIADLLAVIANWGS